MSDLYLVLRERLEAVAEADWLPISTDVLVEARARVGLSTEKLAARIHVSSKTYERWEKAGRVKRASLPAIARELGLRIETTELEPITVEVEPLTDAERGAVLRELASIRAALEAGRAQDRRMTRLERKLDQLLARQEPPRQPSKRAGSSKPR